MISGEAIAELAVSEAPAAEIEEVVTDPVWTCQTGDGEVWTCL